MPSVDLIHVSRLFFVLNLLDIVIMVLSVSKNNP